MKAVLDLIGIHTPQRDDCNYNLPDVCCHIANHSITAIVYHFDMKYSWRRWFNAKNDVSNFTVPHFKSNIAIQ